MGVICSIISFYIHQYVDLAKNHEAIPYHAGHIPLKQQ